MTYDDFASELANLIVVSPSDTNYLTVLPNVVNDAEQRLYRELDPIATVTTASTSVAANTRTMTLPSSVTYVVVQDINYVSSAGSRTPLLRVGREFIDLLYPTATAASTSSVPLYYGMVTEQDVVLGPPPGDTVSMEVVGTVRPTALSSANQTSYLTDRYPDLFMTAAVIFANGYLKNWSAMADDPKAALSWESHLATLLQSAKLEEARKKGMSEGWTTKTPSPVAPRRG